MKAIMNTDFLPLKKGEEVTIMAQGIKNSTVMDKTGNTHFLYSSYFRKEETQKEEEREITIKQIERYTNYLREVIINSKTNTPLTNKALAAKMKVHTISTTMLRKNGMAKLKNGILIPAFTEAEPIFARRLFMLVREYRKNSKKSASEKRKKKAEIEIKKKLTNQFSEAGRIAHLKNEVKKLKKKISKKNELISLYRELKLLKS